MKNKPRKILCTIVTQYGRNLWEEPRRVEGILKDLCGDCPTEIAALVGAAQQRVPQDLAASPDGLPWAAVSVRYVQRLTQQMALSEEAARWAVDTWALAVGRISEKEATAHVNAAQVTNPQQSPRAKPAPPTIGPAPAPSTIPAPMPPLQMKNILGAENGPVRGPVPAPPVIKSRPKTLRPRDDDDDDRPRLKRRRADPDPQPEAKRGIRDNPALLSMILGITALVASIVCQYFAPPIAGILGTFAIVYGLRGRSSGNKSQARIGIICGACGLGIGLLVLAGIIFIYALPLLAKNRDKGKTQDTTAVAKRDISEERMLSNLASNGKMLEAADKDAKQSGSRVQLGSLIKDNPSQRWQMMPFAEDQYLIVCKANGLALEAKNDNDLKTNGCPVQLGTRTNGTHQQWSLEKSGEYVKIINRANGKELEVDPNDVLQEGARIQLWDVQNADRSLWKITCP